MTHEEIEITKLNLPPASIPRPGDKVHWYNDSNKFDGTLIGHDRNCKPVIRNMFNNDCTCPSFDHIRFLKPFERIGPNWERIPTGGKVFKATSEEIGRFDTLLNRYIPPGPKYSDLITEIWHRGFEVYLVGGTVRDVISGDSSFDVDLVTTIPLRKAVPLLQSMYRYRPSIDYKNGFVRLGGKPASGDPFIDLKVFSRFQPGTDNAIFGSDFNLDVGHRDFACNSIYYEPVNKVLIDPSGVGVQDAMEKKLTIVCNPELRNNYQKATIVIRFFKFLCKGYTYTEETYKKLYSDFVPLLSSMKQSLRITYVKTQLLSKHPIENHETILDGFKIKMNDFGISEIWDELFEPIKGDILS